MRAAPPGDGALPVLAGALLALAFPPAAFLLPPFVALVPLLMYVYTRPPTAAGRWAATRGALVTGVVFHGARLAWIVVALADRSAAAIPAWALMVLVLAGLFGLFGWALHFLRGRLALPLVIAAPVLWGALEWTQGHVGPLSFPWLALGSALAPFPRLAGAADLVGVAGLGIWLAAVNAGLAEVTLRSRAGRPIRTLALATGLVAFIPMAYGWVRAATLETRPIARVAVVQTHIPDALKRDRAVALDTSLAVLGSLTSRVAGSGPDLVVWPEVALPVDLAGTPWLVDSVAALSRQVGAPILVGAYGVAAGGGTAYNSAFLVDGAGLGPSRYDKRALVPFVERVPFLPRATVVRWLGDTRFYGGLERGTEGAPLEAGPGLRVGVLICFESIFPALAAGYRGSGADLLVAITNDGWYGRPAWYGRTTALWQHPGHLVLRAIETRTGIARAANVGFSLFVGPSGRVYGRTPLFGNRVVVETVYTTTAPTVFVRWGRWLPPLAPLLAVVLLGAAILGVRREGRSSVGA